MDFATAASQNSVCICIAQQVCHIMILFHNCSMIKDESGKESKVLCHVLNNIGFHMKGKLINTQSVL